MALYRIAVYEVGERIPTWTEYTRSAHPISVARRYLRLLNHSWGGPGGYDRIVSKADVSQVGVRPNGDSPVQTVRAPRKITA